MEGTGARGLGGDMTWTTVVTRMSAALRVGWHRFGIDTDATWDIVVNVSAATAAWLVAQKVLRSDHATFAPFSTLLIMQTASSRSVTKAIRYTGAVILGLVVTALVVTPWRAEPLAFAVMLSIALIAGRWHRLGAQGIEVAVTAVFAYSAFIGETPAGSALSQLPDIAAMVLLGSGIGVVVDIVAAGIRRRVRRSGSQPAQGRRK